MFPEFTDTEKWMLYTLLEHSDVEQTLDCLNSFDHPELMSTVARDQLLDFYDKVIEFLENDSAKWFRTEDTK